MIKIIFSVQGMMCPHCEARAAKAVQETIKADCVTGSHKKGTVEIICADGVDVEAVKGIIEAAGYPVTGATIKKKGLLGLWGKL